MEFIRQLQITLETGEWTQFQFYVIFAWVVMLPRALGAGIFYSFRPAQPARLTTRYLIALTGAIAVLFVSSYYWTLEVIGTWYLLGGTTLAIFIVASPIRRRIVRFLFRWTFYAHHVRLVDQTGPHHERECVAMMTIFDEDPEFLDMCLGLIRNCLKAAGGKFTLISIIDGYGRYSHADAAVPVTKKHCDIVMTSDGQRKRGNLEAMGLEAYNRGLLKTGEEVIHLIDSDVVPFNDQVAVELTRPFADPAVGIVTTAQYVYQPKTFWQHVLQIFETIRNFGSQAFMSLAGAVGCAPGRWYAVLAKYMKPADFRQLNEDTFSLFGFWRVLCNAGDDRCVTRIVLRKFGKVLLAPSAIVHTLAPETGKVFRKMVSRWTWSSHGYTFRSPELITQPSLWLTGFVYWSNVGLAWGTCYIVYIYWPYQIIWGDAGTVFLEAMVFAVMSMAVTMTFRFIPVWSNQLYYLRYMPIMAFVGIMMQTIQVKGMLEHVPKIGGGWGTRGDGKMVKDPTFTVLFEDTQS